MRCPAENQGEKCLQFSWRFTYKKITQSHIFSASNGWYWQVKAIGGQRRVSPACTLRWLGKASVPWRIDKDQTDGIQEERLPGLMEWHERQQNRPAGTKEMMMSCDQSDWAPYCSPALQTCPHSFPLPVFSQSIKLYVSKVYHKSSLIMKVIS